jgi:hypothetical protein
MDQRAFIGNAESTEVQTTVIPGQTLPLYTTVWQSLIIQLCLRVGDLGNPEINLRLDPGANEFGDVPANKLSGDQRTIAPLASMGGRRKERVDFRFAAEAAS